MTQELNNLLSNDLIFGSTLILGGLFIAYIGLTRLFSKKHFLISQGKPGRNITKEYSEISKEVISYERFEHPIGWSMIGIALVFAGLYLLFVK